MSSTPWEQLSLLLDGALEPEEAAALRARIDAEPELAEAWALMQGLPRPSPPCPRLRSRRSSTPPCSPPARRRAAALRLAPLDRLRGGALLALTAWGLRAPEPEALTLLAGDQLVEGRARVLAAGSLPIDVDGRALVRVHPNLTPSPEEDPEMMLREIMAAAAGAAITVAVYEGTASFLPGPEEAPVVVAAGEQVHVDAEGRPAGPQRRVVQVVAPAEGERPAPSTLAEDDLRAEVEALRFENTLLRGQVRAAQGVVQDWPEGTPAALEGPALEVGLAEALGAHGELLELDCAEYPCIASIQLARGYDREALEGALGAFKDGVKAEAGLDELGMMLGIAESRTSEDGEPDGVAVLALLQPDDLGDPDLTERLHTREREAFQAAQPALQEP
ncbi:MAG: hypothetical protein H6741_33775 [Alphaproteobacteria bacterium]|nr:hypothetical protein [Alphaproteobacteria bacterium]